MIKKIISSEDWGISTMSEKQFSVNKVQTFRYTFWDYIQSFYSTFYYENPKRKHTWFIKLCSQIIVQDLPNWFIQWWISHGPSVRILPTKFLQLYNKWVKVSPITAKLFAANHV